MVDGGRKYSELFVKLPIQFQSKNIAGLIIEEYWTLKDPNLNPVLSFLLMCWVYVSKKIIVERQGSDLLNGETLKTLEVFLDNFILLG